MNNPNEPWNNTFARALIVTAMGILLGAALYQFAVFSPAMKAFQFSMNSLSIGILISKSG